MTPQFYATLCASIVLILGSVAAVSVNPDGTSKKCAALVSAMCVINLIII